MVSPIARLSALLICMLIGQIALSHQAPAKTTKSDDDDDDGSTIIEANNFGNIGNGNIVIFSNGDGNETVDDTNTPIENTNFGNIGNGKFKVISGKTKGSIGHGNNFGNIGSNNVIIKKGGANPADNWAWDWGWDWD